MRITAETDTDSASSLPKGWVLAQLGEVAQPSKAKVEPSEIEPATPYLSLEHIETESGRVVGTGKASDVRSTKAVFNSGDVLYGKLRPYLNKVARPNFSGVCSTDIIVFPQTGEIDADFLASFLRQRHVVEYAHHNSQGVQLPRISFDVLSRLEFPLPPLAEQKRVVAKVEDVLARVNAVRERLAKVPKTLKRFRQSVLAAACSGRLTADWRDRHSPTPAEAVLAESAKDVDAVAIRYLVRRGREGMPEVELPELPVTWACKTVRQLVEAGAILDFQDGNHGSLYPRSEDFGDEGVKFLTAAQVFDDRVLFDIAPRLRSAKAKGLRIGFTKPRDVLLTHNATVGRVAVLPDFGEEIILGTSVTYYRTRPDLILPEFLSIAMQGQLWQDQLRSVMEQTTRNQVSITKQVEFFLPIPPIEEQRELVRRVESAFARISRAESRLDIASRRAEKLVQATLAKAFRGELVPTEAELAEQEGREFKSAETLLEHIRQQRNANGEVAEPRPRRRTATTPPADAKYPDTLFEEVGPAKAPERPSAASKSVRTTSGSPTRSNGPQNGSGGDWVDISYDDAMGYVRDAFAEGGARDRERAIHDVAVALGYQRVGSRVRETVDGYLRAAVRRGILVNENAQYSLLVHSAAEYSRDHLIDRLIASLNGGWVERDEAVRATAKHLGFQKAGSAFKEAMKSAINGAIRRGLLEHEGEMIRKS